MNGLLQTWKICRLLAIAPNMVRMTSHCFSRDWRQFGNLHATWKALRYGILFGLAVLLTLVFSGYLNLATAQEVLPQTPIQRNFQEIRGVWFTTNDIDVMRDHNRLQEAVNKLAQLNFNTIYVVVWNSGYVLYPSPVAQQAQIQPFVRRGLQGQDMLADLINIAHRRGLLVVPWFEFGFMAPPTSELTEKHPQWLTQKQDGGLTSMSAAGEVSWLNPLHPQVQQFISDLVLEVLSRYNVDGVQFDDHMALPVEFGYDRYTTDLYRQEILQDPPTDPRDPAWVSWRANKITAFMASLYQSVKSKKPPAIFSVSPNPYSLAYNSFLQDWLNWVRQGIVDELIVQIYRSDLQSFVDQINRPEVQEVKQRIPVGVGILTGLRTRQVPMRLIQYKVMEARYFGLGFSFFFYESLWDVAPEPAIERQSSFRALFSRPAVRRIPL